VKDINKRAFTFIASVFLLIFTIATIAGQPHTNESMPSGMVAIEENENIHFFNAIPTLPVVSITNPTIEATDNAIIVIKENDNILELHLKVDNISLGLFT